VVQFDAVRADSHERSSSCAARGVRRGLQLLLDAREPHDLGYAPNAFRDACQVQAVVDLDGEMHGGVEAAVLVHAHVVDVGTRLGDGGGHFGEHTALVGGHDTQPDV